MSITQITIGRDGTKVLLTINGKTTCIPWEHADEIARGIITKAREAEEEQKALLIAGDNAILLRLGVPLGFSDRKDIQQETAFQAQYNDKLRKYLPGGVKSKEMFGTPSIIRHDPVRSGGDNG